MRVAFLVPGLELTGGVGVAIGHAARLRSEHGFDAEIVIARDDRSAPEHRDPLLAGFPIRTLAEAATGEPFDVAIATWWETTLSLHQLPAARYAYFVQSMEDRFYGATEPLARAAAMTHALPLAQITIASWIAEQLAALRPGAATVPIVRNGIDKQTFTAEGRVAADGPLRIVIEGSPAVALKGVPEAIAAARAMVEPAHVTLVAADRAAADREAAHVDRVLGPLSAERMAELYRESDVLLKLSRVEGMAGPPIEAFHCGATVVTTPVTGHDEYIVDGENALVTSWDDERGTARLLDLLATDRELLARLEAGALATAAQWPSSAASTAEMANVLADLAAAPDPDPGRAAAAMAGEIRATLVAAGAAEREHARLQARMARVERLMDRWPLRVVRRRLAGD